MTTFWKNWLTVWCCSVGLFGIVLAGAGAEATSAPTRLVFQILNGPGPFEFDAPMRFSIGVLGAVSIGWSITLFAAIRAALMLDRKTAAPIWALIAASALSWFVIDSSLSIYTGFWRNTIPNLAYLATFLLPLYRSGAFRGEN